VLRRVCLVLLFLCMFVCTSIVLAFSNEFIGLLGETVSWTIPPVCSTDIRLQKTPLENLKGIPQVKGLLFGAMKLGNGKDNLVSIAVLLEGPPQLWIDANNNEDLSDDEHIMWDFRDVNGNTYFWHYLKVQAEYQVKGETVMLPVYVDIYVSIYVSMDPVIGEIGVDYSVVSHREGLIEIDDKLYPIALSLIHTTSYAIYNNLNDLIFGIDIDRDNKIDVCDDSYELFKVDEPFYVGNKAYEIKLVSPDGRKLVLVESNRQAVRRPILRRGHPSPDFQTTTLEGKTFSLSDLREKVVMLYFAPSSCVFPPLNNESHCSSCSYNVQSQYYQRMSDLESIVEVNRGKVVLVWILTDREEPKPDLIKKLQEEISIMVSKGTLIEELPLVTMIWDPKVTELYLYPWERLFILDENGTIRATDECWFELRNGKIKGGVKKLLYVDPIVEDIINKK